jgi:hypothetical protein
MLLNSDELQPYLQYAFDHFSRDLETPFDFVQASFSNNPIPANFGGYILKLAINIMEVWKDHLDGPNIFKELSFMVASCIMLDSARHRTLGPAEKASQISPNSTSVLCCRLTSSLLPLDQRKRILSGSFADTVSDVSGLYDLHRSSSG